MRAQKTEQYRALQSEELALHIAETLDSRQAEDIVILDVSGPLAIADYFVIATARNPRHAQSLAKEVDFHLKHSGLQRRNASGMDGDSTWVLLDFDDVVVHVFLEEARSFYALENLWADVPRVPFTPRTDKTSQPEGASRPPWRDLSSEPPPRRS